MRNHSYENEVHLHVHFHTNQTHFHLNGFARGLVLKLRQGTTRKWPITILRQVYNKNVFGNNCNLFSIFTVSDKKYKIPHANGRKSCSRPVVSLTHAEKSHRVNRP